MNPIAVYEFTLKKQDKQNENEIIKILYPTIVKKISFQLEKSDEGYEHYQGRISLVKKRRMKETLDVLKPHFPDIHISPTCNNGLTENFYTTKEDTRIDGPWTEKSYVYVPRQIREIVDLKPWQKSVVLLSRIWDTRTINIIVDTEGNIGKSTLTTYMGIHNLAKQIPFCNDYKDVLRMVCDMPTSGCFIIDMPRAIRKEKLYQMYSAIETIKSGYAYDERYHFKDKYFDCPCIWVFTNIIPDETLLSRDRWRKWEIINEELKKFDPLMMR
ncbi:replication-associated protein [Avon-Heathcote Estuary associated circular virus 22]|uniref:replication-associated protein n=1 Tax=Avon-Heathcote Estuary associated circular virus 22 TaxID=1618246 RepID=UPI0005CCFE1A|nr:replication-associated protein [Avon-Heathcote Estuary associated circular virus 22]AJP36454.1 replication-associated protein [Avon-Heathcote Estuary associated circular virus 22]AJP36455.1 replication-associated protein [Avon-Heathcote Estuary associated circular virus 22]